MNDQKIAVDDRVRHKNKLQIWRVAAVFGANQEYALIERMVAYSMKYEQQEVAVADLQIENFGV